MAGKSCIILDRASFPLDAIESCGEECQGRINPIRGCKFFQRRVCSSADDERPEPITDSLLDSSWTTFLRHCQSLT